MSKLRDSIRSITVGRKVDYKKIEKEFEGEKIVFVQPSRKTYRDIINRSTINDKIDGVALQLNCLIELVESVDGEKVFEQADFDTLMAQPTGGFVDEFSEIALSLLGNQSQGSDES